MTISLFDISVATYQQMVGATAGYLAKGKAHCEENGIDLNEVVATRLYPDMADFRFQVYCVAHHSLATVEAMSTGEFGPPTGYEDYDYEGLQSLIGDTLEKLNGHSADDVNALESNDIIFKLGEMQMPFTVPNFVLSFSHPNVYFHAATTYDILRMKGVPVGKRDFMGMPRIKS